MHLTAKFHRPMFHRSEVIMLTNKQTETPMKTSTSPRYATPMGNDCARQRQAEAYSCAVCLLEYTDAECCMFQVIS